MSLPKNEMSRGASSRSIIREHELTISTVVSPMPIPHAPEVASDPRAPHRPDGHPAWQACVVRLIRDYFAARVEAKEIVSEIHRSHTSPDNVVELEGIASCRDD